MNTEEIMSDILNLAKHMDSFDVGILRIALAGMNEGLDNWYLLSESDQASLRESFGSILALSKEARRL
jgi:adenine C2-methylase RlmN of 23S rRNA A2503 and tRNA A37